MIKIRDLEFRYPDSSFELRVGSLDIAGGERVAFIGKSGCGKTTLAHLIAGIHRSLGGEIEGEEDLGGIPAFEQLGGRGRRFRQELSRDRWRLERAVSDQR